MASQQDELEPTNIPSLPFLHAREARRRLFDKRARNLLRRMDEQPYAVRAVADNCAYTTALTCALATTPHIECLNLSQNTPEATTFNRTRNINITKLVGMLWPNLRALIMKGCAFSTEVFRNLLEGPARNQLQLLDLSSTFINDSELELVAQFKNLKELQLNDCHIITSAGIATISRNLKNLEVLGLRHLPIGASGILVHLMVNEELVPLPQLRLLNMESDSWSRHISIIKEFAKQGRHPPLLEEANFIPELDMHDPILLEGTLPRFVSIRGSEVRLSRDTKCVNKLHVQVPMITQTDIEVISAACPNLNQLTFWSAQLTVAPDEIKLSSFANVTNLRLVDVYLGYVVSLPPRLHTLIATPSSIKSNVCRDSFIAAICACASLAHLHLLAPSGDSHTAVFEPETISQIFNSLINLEEIILDLDSFGQGVEQGAPVQVEIRHERAQTIKFYSALGHKVDLKIDFVPSIQSFEASTHQHSVAFINCLPHCSKTIRSLRLKFDPQRLSEMEKTNPEMLKKMAEAVAKCKHLTRLHLHGAPASVVDSLNRLHRVHTITLVHCNLPSTGPSLVSLRDLQLIRCSSLKSLNIFQCPCLSRLSISGCPDVRDSLIFHGKSMPALEMLSVSHQDHLHDILIRDLPELRFATLDHINAYSLTIDTNPNLRDLTVDASNITRTKVISPRLQRLFFDCGRAFQSIDSEDSNDGVSIKFDAPALTQVSLQAEDIDLPVLLQALERSDKLEHIDLNSVMEQELSELEVHIRDRFPALRRIGCNDGDVILQSSKTPRF